MPINNPAIVLVLFALSSMGCSSSGSIGNPGIKPSGEPSTTPNARINTAPDFVSVPSPTYEAVQQEVDNIPEAVQVTNNTLSCGANSEQFQILFIQLVNQVRAQPRRCGDTSFGAATAIRWNTQLESAARRHSVDMATNNFFSHTGSDNTRVSDRVEATSYQWQSVGENLAAGQTSLQQAIDGWLDSPSHCRILMNTSFKDAGLACVENQSTEFSTYWTSVFGIQFE